MSGLERSSTKQIILCATVKPVVLGLSKGNFILREKLMYQALYRQYRPEIFEDVIGQDTIVNILKGQIEMNKLVHAYLFSGTRGTGKTTTARLLAKAVNCLAEENRPCGVCENCKSIQNGTFIDLIEIDAASNNGVNDIRELREGVNFPPAMGKMKVYIIDEVHALTKEAFNAFLKTLEEPPEKVIFVLATTEPNKLPATILSRCLRLDFKRVSDVQLARRMEQVISTRDVEIDQSSLMLIAANADGSVRDGLTLLEQCIAGKKGVISRDDILDALGAVREDFFVELVENIHLGNPSNTIIALSRALDSGRDARQLVSGLMNYYRNLLLVKFIKNPENSMNMSYENIHRIKEQADKIDLWQIEEAVMELANTSKQMESTTQPRILLEVSLVKLSTKKMKTQSSSINHEVYISNTKVDLSLNTSDVKTNYTDKEGETGHVDRGDAKEPTSQQQPEEDISPAKIWSEVEKKLVAESPKFMVLNNMRARDIINGELCLEFKNNMASTMIAQNVQKINELIKEVSGKSLRVKIETKKREADLDEDLVKSKFKELSGINLEIK